MTRTRITRRKALVAAAIGWLFLLAVTLLMQPAKARSAPLAKVTSIDITAGSRFEDGHKVHWYVGDRHVPFTVNVHNGVNRRIKVHLELTLRRYGLPLPAGYLDGVEADSGCRILSSEARLSCNFWIRAHRTHTFPVNFTAKKVGPYTLVTTSCRSSIAGDWCAGAGLVVVYPR